MQWRRQWYLLSMHYPHKSRTTKWFCFVFVFCGARAYRWNLLLSDESWRESVVVLFVFYPAYPVPFYSLMAFPSDNVIWRLNSICRWIRTAITVIRPLIYDFSWLCSFFIPLNPLQLHARPEHLQHTTPIPKWLTFFTYTHTHTPTHAIHSG